MSSSRPGVATSTSQPRSSSRIWSPKGEPPYATQIRSPVRNANFFDSSWICCASSRVGASASARIATCGGRSAAVGGWQMCVHLAGSVERGDRSSKRNERSLCVVSWEPAIPKKEGGLRPPPDARAGAPHCQHRGVSRLRGWRVVPSRAHPFSSATRRSTSLSSHSHSHSPKRRSVVAFASALDTDLGVAAAAASAVARGAGLKELVEDGPVDGETQKTPRSAFVTPATAHA